MKTGKQEERGYRMPEQYVGEIRIFGGNFAPQYWALCEGQFLSIADNQELFAVIGTTYGGDGVSNFALPDLRGRVPMGQGEYYPLGTLGGHETIPLEEDQIPSHTHATLTAELAQGATATGTGEGYVACVTSGETTSNPEGMLPGKPSGSKRFYSSTAPETYMAGQGIQLDDGGLTIDFDVDVANEPFGGSNPHNNMQPFGCVTYIIALQGLFPPRS
jgi:microcystin-dependent protein